MYSISQFGTMITDAVRMEVYVKALRAAVKPDSVVVDIGTGTGIFALLAAKMGARKIYAIEPDDAIQLAKQIATANHLAHKIEFIQDISTNVSLPELADVIISDLRGVLPLYQHHIPAIMDARKRLLATNGVMIPMQDTLWVTLVEAENLYARIIQPWASRVYDLDMTAARRIVTNSWRKERIPVAQHLVQPQQWAHLDYASIESPHVEGRLIWIAARNGTAHGLSCWFDTLLAPDTGYSNAPDLPELVYGNAFFPLTEPVQLEAGDKIEVRITAKLVGQDYVWTWDTKIANAHNLKADFKQSTFYSTLLSANQLHKRAHRYVPHLSNTGTIDLMVLSLMQQSKSIGEIATQILQHFPLRFSDFQAAFTYVSDLSIKYSD